MKIKLFVYKNKEGHFISNVKKLKIKRD